MPTANQVRQLWLKSELSQREFGERLGVTQNHIAKVLNGSRQLSPGLWRLACLFYKFPSIMGRLVPLLSSESGEDLVISELD